MWIQRFSETTNSIKKRVLLATAFTALTAMLALSIKSSAAGPVKPKLSFFKSNAAIGWSTEGGSSPSDPTNTESLRIVTKLTGTSAAGAFTFGNAEAANTIVGRMLGQIDNLSFDAKGVLGAGAPRISLTTIGDDGNHTYFLSAFHCNDPLSGDWVEADFIHDITSCLIFRDSEIAGQTWSTHVTTADANNETVTDWFLIVDEGPTTIYVDKLVVQDWQWIRQGTPGIRSCLDVNPSCNP